MAELFFRDVSQPSSPLTTHGNSSTKEPVLDLEIEQNVELAIKTVVRCQYALTRMIDRSLRPLALRRLVDADDVFQFACQMLIEGIQRHRLQIADDRQLVGLFKVIARRCRDRLRASNLAKRRDCRRVESLAASVRDVRIASHPDEDIFHDRTALGTLMLSVRQQLSDNERVLLDARNEGFSWKELADEVGTSASAVRMRVLRALSRAIVSLEDLSPDGRKLGQVPDSSI